MRKYKAEEPEQEATSGKTENHPSKMSKMSKSDLNQKGPESGFKKSKTKLSFTDQPVEIIESDPNVELSEKTTTLSDLSVSSSCPKESDQPQKQVEIVPPSKPSEQVLFPTLESMSDPSVIGVRTLTGSPIRTEQAPIEHEVKLIICVYN
jgi:hypothetical protein